MALAARQSLKLVHRHTFRPVEQRIGLCGFRTFPEVKFRFAAFALGRPLDWEWGSLALDAVDAFALAFERTHAPALLANAGRKKTPHTVPLPPGEVLDLAHRCSFRPAEQGVHLGCFRSLPEAGFGLLSFAWRLPLGLLGRLDGSPDSFNCDLSTRELFDRRAVRQSVPDGDQPLQRPRTRYSFPILPGSRSHSLARDCLPGPPL